MPETAISGQETRPKSLNILPEDNSLRAPGPFRKRSNWGEDVESQPRALRGLARIVDGGLCHRCGSCVGICPTGVLGVDSEGYPKVKALSACTDCDLCVKVCPGDELNVELEHQELFGHPADLLATHGEFKDASVSYALDPAIREGSTSGGTVTAILCWLLETKQIDGALIIVSDDTELWKGKPIIARTRDEILSGMKSKYAITPTNVGFEEIRQTPGRYAVVGLPCQIHGLRKAQRLDARLKERVVLAIGLFCHAAIEHEAFRVIWETLGRNADGAKRFVSRIGKHPGTPHIERADGSLYPVYFGSKSGYRPSSIEVINILYRLYTPERCTTCFDGLSDFADIAVGDPWLSPPEPHVDYYDGWSFALCRTQAGLEIYNQAINAGALKSVHVTEREALSSNKLMAHEKRWRAFRVIETHRRQGKPIPRYGDYDIEFPRHQGFQFVKTEIHMLTHIFCFLPKLRASVLRFFLGNGGYFLFWLNSLRRRFRVWSRDSLYRLKSRIFGRR